MKQHSPQNTPNVIKEHFTKREAAADMQTCSTNIWPCGTLVGNYMGENTSNHILIVAQKPRLFRNNRSIKVLEKTLVLSELSEMDPSKRAGFIFHLLPHWMPQTTWKCMKNISAHSDNWHRPLEKTTCFNELQCRKFIRKNAYLSPWFFIKNNMKRTTSQTEDGQMWTQIQNCFLTQII